MALWCLLSQNIVFFQSCTVCYMKTFKLDHFQRVFLRQLCRTIHNRRFIIHELYWKRCFHRFTKSLNVITDARNTIKPVSVLELFRKDLLKSGFLVVTGVLLRMRQLRFRFVKLFEALNRLLFGLPQETLHILHLVSQVVVGLLQGLHFLGEVFDFLFLLK